MYGLLISGMTFIGLCFFVIIINWIFLILLIDLSWKNKDKFYEFIPKLRIIMGWVGMFSRFGVME